MHAGAVRVDNQKMSKSLGNFFTIRDVLKKYHPEIIRYFLLSSHYRTPINYSEENLIEAKSGLERFYITLRNFPDIKPLSVRNLKKGSYYKLFVQAMDDDFNTREAIAIMYELARHINTLSDNYRDAAVILVSKRSAAKNNNNFIEADEIRAQLLANGIVLEDTRNGTTWRRE